MMYAEVLPYLQPLRQALDDRDVPNFIKLDNTTEPHGQHGVLILLVLRLAMVQPSQKLKSEPSEATAM